MKGFVACAIAVLLSSMIMANAHAYEVSGHLSAGECDYWWICNVEKGDLVLLTINGGSLSWESRLSYSNLTVVKTVSDGATHIYEFFANETDDYLLRLYSSYSFSYTIQCNHNISEQTMCEVSEYLSAGECDYWWICNVEKGDLVLLTINGGSLSWESRLYYSNLTVVKIVNTGGTHVYEFFANKTDDYLLRLCSSHSSDYTIQCNHLVCWGLVTIPGDINGDNKVNHNDLLLLASAYGSKCGDPQYIPQADIKCDGKIDHKDLLILAANYGKMV
jgi:hypothetical protein